MKVCYQKILHCLLLVLVGLQACIPAGFMLSGSGEGFLEFCGELLPDSSYDLIVDRDGIHEAADYDPKQQPGADTPCPYSLLKPVMALDHLLASYPDNIESNHAGRHYPSPAFSSVAPGDYDSRAPPQDIS